MLSKNYVIEDLKFVYAVDNAHEVTFINEPAPIRFFEGANDFGFVKNYNGKGITRQVTPTLNSVFRLAYTTKI